jgi:hypothetical protein
MHHFRVLVRNNEYTKCVRAFTPIHTHTTRHNGLFLSYLEVHLFKSSSLDCLPPCGRSIHKLFEPNTCLDQIDGRWHENSIDSKRIQSGHQLCRTASRAHSWWWWLGTLSVAFRDRTTRFSVCEQLGSNHYTEPIAVCTVFKVILRDGVLLLCLPLTDSMEKFFLEKLLVSHLTEIFQLCHEHESCILTHREAHFMSQLNHYHNLTPQFEKDFMSSLWSFRIKILYAYIVSSVRTVGLRHLVLFIFNTQFMLKM